MFKLIFFYCELRYSHDCSLFLAPNQIFTESFSTTNFSLFKIHCKQHYGTKYSLSLTRQESTLLNFFSNDFLLHQKRSSYNFSLKTIWSFVVQLLCVFLRMSAFSQKAVLFHQNLCGLNRIYALSPELIYTTKTKKLFLQKNFLSIKICVQKKTQRYF